MITAAAPLHAPNLPSDRQLRRHLEELDEVGYTIIHGWLDPETTATLRSYVDGVLPPVVPADQPLECRRHEIRHPMRDCGFMARVLSDGLLSLATTLLQAEDLRLLEQVFCRTDPMPGPGGPQGWHVDRVMFPRHRRARPRQIYHHLVHALSDVRRGGAALMVVPGSHRLTWAAAERFEGSSLIDYRGLGAQVIEAAGIDLSKGIEVLAREGDLIVFDPMCVHSSSINRRTEPRYVLFQSFFDASATELNELWEGTSWRSGFPDELRAALPERLRSLLLR